MVDEYILEMKGISKAFPGVQALKRVDFNLQRGEVHALVGENGAGKSTLVKILSGVYKKDEGDIVLNRTKVEIGTPQVARELGIATIYQELAMVPQLSVAENIFLGRPIFGKFHFINRAAMEEKAKVLLESLGVSIQPSKLVEDLSIGQRQLVEIAKALSLDAKIIVMDEPTSSLSQTETEYLFKVIDRLKSNGISIVYISHRFEEILNVADRISVIRDGNNVGTLSGESATHEKIIELMVGRKIEEFYVKVNVERGEPIFSVENLWRKGVFYDISFAVREGEILGITGLVGAGKSEVVRSIFGLDPFDGGKILFNNQEIFIKSPINARHLGIGFLPETRKEEGLMLPLSVRRNISITILDSLCKWGLINNLNEVQLVENYVKTLKVKTPTIEEITVNLSGGNQQKVAIAKWLGIMPKLLILDEPTKGIDVGAKSEIYALISELVKNKVGIILVSSDLDEVMAISDSLIVMHEGIITGHFKTKEVSKIEVLSAATGFNNTQTSIFSGTATR
ncbi:MAG: sugar ABC transporter ATP-binding protein [Atribacter sp.]|uniref:Ribose import ATP-binding protein RbsA n=1 Tax=Candidatus Atribacter allofermentans TaxID=1852833 RepID=A0A1V5SMI1_9BACT|nr:sugar ABC transporter ATP-binding protein [Atribacterota bacterium]OQA55685.1 MAG: Ribose import ATP-binding protein RbsA [Candidatus Atribacteria bacterium ADurb.Bin276]